MSEFKEAIEKYNKLQSELKSIAKDHLKDYLKSLCNDVIPSFRFRAYTPYFNDGEPCRYRIEEVYCKFEGLGEEDGEREDGFDYSSDDKVINENIRKVSDGVYFIPRDLMLHAIGDHAMVTVTKDIVDVEQIDHD